MKDFSLTSNGPFIDLSQTFQFLKSNLKSQGRRSPDVEKVDDFGHSRMVEFFTPSRCRPVCGGVGGDAMAKYTGVPRGVDVEVWEEPPTRIVNNDSIGAFELTRYES